jgi:hypothetical protein
MRFHRERNLYQNMVINLVSEDRSWAVHLNNTLYNGGRVNVWDTTSIFEVYQTEYCAGADPNWKLALMTVVVKIMEHYPEGADPALVFRQWPRQRFRPMARDPFCWFNLTQLAGLTIDLHQILVDNEHLNLLDHPAELECPREWIQGPLTSSTARHRANAGR